MCERYRANREGGRKRERVRERERDRERERKIKRAWNGHNPEKE